jgi:oxygen-independent coproporphyrinogen III oxidase
MHFGIYIHIPFCSTRCNYCHFIVRPWEEKVANDYSRAVLAEIRTVFGPDFQLTGAEADTVYFGGGTPSLVPPDHIIRALTVIREEVNLRDDAEISLEANPGSLTAEGVRQYRDSGINRISLGAQTFDDSQLLAIGRDHSGADIRQSINLLRVSGIRNINLDLMIGLPGQDSKSLARDLEEAVQLRPEHISVYMLDLDDRSPLFHEIRKGKRRVPDDDQLADYYFSTIDFLSSAGYRQYEISNFSIEGFESRHNLKYWKREPVLGIGVGSHSFDGTRRYSNEENIARYMRAVKEGISPVIWEEPHDLKKELEEALFVGLRLLEGVNWQALKDSHPASEDLDRFEQAIADLSRKGLLEWHGPAVRLTRRGLILSNEVLAEFV